MWHLGYPKVIPYTKFKHFGSFVFSYAADMQTDRRTRTYYPRRPTEVGAGNNNNNNKEEEEEENYVQIQSFAADRNKL